MGNEFDEAASIRIKGGMIMKGCVDFHFGMSFGINGIACTIKQALILFTEIIKQV